MTKRVQRKILFIITDLGSFNNFLGELAMNLASENTIDIHVISSPNKVIDINDKYNYSKYGITFHFVRIPRGFNLLNQIKASREIHQIINVLNPDLIHAHFTTGSFTTVLYKKPVQALWGTFHGLGFTVTSGLKSIVFKLIENFCFSRLDKIFVLNDSDYKCIKNEYPDKASRYKSLGLGCDIHKFNLSNYTLQNQITLKNKLKINDQKIITFMGRFTDFKGFQIVAHAFFFLAEKNPGVYKLLLIGGRDPIHGTGLNEQDESRIFNHPDTINVGYTDQVAKYLAITDIFVFPSKREGVPVCILEALSMGLPVITCDSRGCNEIIKDGYNGYLIDPQLTDMESAHEVVEKITNLVLDSEIYSTLRSNALKDREKYDRGNFIKEETSRYLTFFLTANE